MRLSRALMAAAVVALFALTPLAARADEQSDLEKGRVAYLARRYDEADARFRAMLDPVSGTLHDATLVSRARMYWGAVLLARGQSAPATSIFEKLLLDDPTFEPDPLSFPADVVNTFIDTRERMRERLSALAAAEARREADLRARDEAEKKRQAAHLALVEKLASEEVTTHVHSRWIAVLPFGVGQFQNGDTALGWVFLGAEAALVVGATIALPIYTTQDHAGFAAYAQGQTFEAQEYFDRANTARVVNIALLGTAIGVALGGIVEAEAVYKPDVVEIKKRDIPTAWTIVPKVNPTLSLAGQENGQRTGRVAAAASAGFEIRF